MHRETSVNEPIAPEISSSRRRHFAVHGDGEADPRSASAGRGPFPVYVASQIKTKRKRAKKDEVASRRDELYRIIEAMQPMTVRQVFYQASVRRLIDKSESGYTKVQTDLTLLRKAGKLPYEWLADNTRWQRKPSTVDGPDHMLKSAAKTYRKDLWCRANAYVEIWLEKDALAGVLMPVTELMDVPLMVARGYASLSFLHSAATYIAGLKVPTYIYHLGDFDPSGVNAGEKIEETLRKLAPNAEIHFERLGVNEKQIQDWRLPGRPTKKSDTRAKKFGHEESVELDAISPDLLRDLVKSAVERHLPPHELKVLKEAEESERQFLGGLVGLLEQAGKFREKPVRNERD
jgi:hypothetical protein